MKKYIIALLILLLAVPAFGAQTVSRHLEPEIPVLNTMAYGLGGKVIDGWYANQIVRVMKEQGIYSSAKFLCDANVAIIKDGSNATSNCIDYSGNANHALQATGANQPIWTANQQNGKYGLVFTSTSSQYLTTPAITGLNGNTISAIFVGKVNSATTTYILWRTNQIVGTGGYVFGMYSESNNFSMHSRVATVGTIKSVTKTNSTNYAVLSLIWNAGNTVDGWANGVVGTQAVGATATTTNNAISIGCNPDATNYLNGGGAALQLFSSALTTSQRQAMESVINTYYAIY